MKKKPNKDGEIHKANKVKYLITILVIGGIYWFFLHSDLFTKIFVNQDQLRENILSFGLLAPLAIVVLQTVQTIFSIFPSQITTIMAGFIFGPVLGLFYSLLGAVLGSTIVFKISQKYGKEIAVKLFDKKEIVRFNSFLKDKKLGALFLGRVVPIFPNDMISFAAGLTRMKFLHFNLVSTLGFFVQMIVLTIFGSELASGKVSMPLIIIGIIIILLLIIVIFKRKIQKIVMQDFYILEHQIEKEFKKI